MSKRSVLSTSILNHRFNVGLSGVKLFKHEHFFLKGTTIDHHCQDHSTSLLALQNLLAADVDESQVLLASLITFRRQYPVLPCSARRYFSHQHNPSNLDKGSKPNHLLQLNGYRLSLFMQ